MALLIASLGVLWLVRHEAQQSAEADVGERARWVAASLSHHLRPSDFASPAEGPAWRRWTRSWTTTMSGLLHVKLWSRDGRVAYSDEHSLIGSTKADLNDLGLALGGATVEEVGELRDERGNGADVKVLEAFVLMYVEGSDRPAGVLEVVQDYEPSQRPFAGSFCRSRLRSAWRCSRSG